MYCVVFITAKNVQEAKRISQRLLEKKLIACANLIKDVQSFFWWEGKVDHAKEVLLILKSKRSCFNRIVKEVKKVHSYNVPEIIALPIVKGYNPYLRWINDSTKKAKRK
jgi:periplasmic divalent cation tolerance protein